jgi:hypothetical protein
VDECKVGVDEHKTSHASHLKGPPMSVAGTNICHSAGSCCICQFRRKIQYIVAIIDNVQRKRQVRCFNGRHIAVLEAEIGVNGRKAVGGGEGKAFLRFVAFLGSNGDD